MNDTWVTLRSDALTARIDPIGAQLSVLTDDTGGDLLWNGDPAVWAGRAPLLFPIVGALAGGSYRLGDRVYPLPRHGFARGKPFTLRHSTANEAVFSLSADEATLAVYPFQFELSVQFTVQGCVLSITASVLNRGGTDMAASVGFHPGFRWPLPHGAARALHYLEFERDEPRPVRRLDAAGLLTPNPHPTPVRGRRLMLNDQLFADDVIIFDALESRAVRYGSDAGPNLRVAFPDAPYLGVWTKPGAPFVCIEPWHGVADVVGYAGDLMKKTGICVLAPGANLSTTMTVGWDGAARHGKI